MNFKGTEQPVGNQLASGHMGHAQQRTRRLSKHGHSLGVGPGAPAAHARQKARCIFGAQCDVQMIGQQRLGWLQAGQALGLVHGLQIGQGDAAVNSQATGVNAAQKGQVGATTECRSDVFAERADIRAIAACNYDFDSWLRTDTVRYRLICTEKDAVKLWKTHSDALAVPLQFSPEPAFFTAVDQLLDAALSSPDPISRRP